MKKSFQFSRYIYVSQIPPYILWVKWKIRALLCLRFIWDLLALVWWQLYMSFSRCIYASQIPPHSLWAKWKISGLLVWHLFEIYWFLSEGNDMRECTSTCMQDILGLDSIWICCLSNKGNPIIFSMGIPILVRHICILNHLSACNRI